MTTSAAPEVVWTTSLQDSLDHAVEPVRVDVGQARMTLCGTWIRPAPEHAVPRPPCRDCGGIVLGADRPRRRWWRRT